MADKKVETEEELRARLKEELKAELLAELKEAEISGKRYLWLEEFSFAGEKKAGSYRRKIL